MRLPDRISRLAERESLRPDFNRALRSTTAIMVPLILGGAGHLPVETTFATLAAQNVAMVDIRGAYSLRFTLLLAMIAVLAGSAGLGGLAAPSLAGAVLAMGFVALAGGLWRHLSADYGPSLAISSTLLFTIAAAARGDPAIAGRHELATLAGGLLGLTLQVGLWPFRPQHHLRVLVSDAWVALADLPAANPLAEPESTAVLRQRAAGAEAALRAALENARGALQAAAASRRLGAIAGRLDELNRTAGLLGVQVGALNGALEALVGRPDFRRVAPSFPPVFTALANTARTVALAVVSRQPGHLATFDVRERRLASLLRVLESRVLSRMPGDADAAHLAEILRQLGRNLAGAGAALRATIERANERAAFSLELFDLATGKLRPLAAALNLNPHPDPALVRLTLRTAVMTMAGVVAMKLLQLPHGYWLPFTVVVVLQPDYGSTRQKAVQRVIGTLIGGALASVLLWLHPSHMTVMFATAAMGFAFTFYLKRNYGVAVVFITLFVVLLTEASGGFNLSFAVERMASTVAGGLFALVAALVFWPAWERDRFPPILARALRANRAYLLLLVERISEGRGFDEAAARAKEEAESANSAVFSSLQRMNGDPRNRQEGIERAAALANGNQRLTRVLNVITLHLEPGARFASPELAEFARRAADALEALAAAVEKGDSAQGRLEPLREALDASRQAEQPDAAGGPADQRQSWIVSQLTRAGTELSAMLLA